MPKSLTQLVKEIGRHFAVYSIGWFANSFASIALMPVYTRFLSRSHFGILEMIDLVKGMLMIFIVSGFAPAMARFFHNSKDKSEQKTTISTAIWFVIFSSFIWVSLGRFYDALLAELIFGDPEMAIFVDLGFTLLFLESLFNISSSYFNIVRRPKIFVGYSVVKLVVNIPLNLFFIIWLDMGPAGILFGNIFALMLICPLVVLHCFHCNGLRANLRLMGEMLKFGLPFVPAVLCAALMHGADRYLLRSFETLAAVGIYGIGYKFPFMLNSMLSSTFSRVWNSSIMYEVSKHPAAEYEFARIATYFTTFFCFSQYVLAIVSPLVIRILAAPEYFEAYRVVQIVCLGMCFYCLHSFFVIGAFIKNRTRFLPYAYVVGTLINLFLNVILIPRMGYLGAAWSSVATYFCFSFTGYLVFRRVYSIPFEFGRLSFLYGTGISFGLLNYFLAFDLLWFEIAKEVLFIVAFPLALLFFPYLNSGEQEKLERFLNGMSPILARGYAAFLRNRI